MTSRPRQLLSRAPRPLAALAALVAGEVAGDSNTLIDGVATLEGAREGQLSFFANAKYKKQFSVSKASAVLVSRDFVGESPAVVLVRVDHPHLAFARIAQEFTVPKVFSPGVAPGAHVHSSAQVDPTATIAPGATVSRDARVAARAVIGPGCFLGERSQVGEGSHLVANVSVLEDCVVGARCLLHPGVVIGGDGFGFAFDASVPAHVKIPQTGLARVEDDVEIGANSCVDRATTGETVIGRGTKIDNLVQVGHNCVVGPLSILCAQVGLSGSTEVGTGVVLAGQAGVAGHLRIGDMAKVGAQAGVMADVDDGVAVLGAPSLPAREFMRSSAVFARLPELQKHLRALERRIAELEAERKKS